MYIIDLIINRFKIVTLQRFYKSFIIGVYGHNYVLPYFKN
jgi:hypothetical protein